MAASTESAKRLEGRVAVVTGASSGIGEAIAEALAAEGAAVALAARRAEKLADAVARIEAAGGRAVAVATDVTKRDDVKRLVATAEEALGPVDIMVNNAGCMYFTMMRNVHEDEWERTVDVNIKGVLNGVGAVLPGMLERGRGHIITTSSDAGRRVFPALAVYCASKHFVEVMSEGLRREVVGTGIKVTTIQPGDVGSTELVMKNSDAEAAEKMGVQIGKPVGEGFSDMQLLHVRDVANAVVYAATAPPHVAINEVLIEPRDQE